MAVENINVGSEIVDGLTKVGDALKPYAERGWEIVVRQSYVTAWQLSVAIVISLIAFCVCLRLWISWTKSTKYEKDNPMLFLWVGIIIPPVVAFICTIEAIGRFINPEYYALMNIIGK